MTKEQFNEELNALIEKAPKENLFFLCYIDDNGVSTMNIKCSEMFMATMINGIFMRYSKVKELVGYVKNNMELELTDKN